MGKGSRNKAARRGGTSAKDYYRSCPDAGVHKTDLAAIKSSEEMTETGKPAIDEKQLFKLYSTIATNVWRMKNQILDTETKEPKDGVDGRVVGKLARYLASLDGALEDAGVQVLDYTNMKRSDGDAVKVISEIERSDLKKPEYVETLLPTVRWKDTQGQTRLLQQAEVIVGSPTESSNN